MASGNSITSINGAGSTPEFSGGPVSTVSGARPPGRPRDQSLTIRRREEIIIAASHIFAKNGFRATDLNQVAESLGVAKGTIYNYFESKTELFLACVDLGKSGLMKAHQEAVAGAEDKSLCQIRSAICAYFQFFDQNPQHIELMMQARGEFKDNSLLNCEEHCRSFAPLIELLQRGVDRGEIRPLSVKGMHDVLLNMVVGAIFSKHFGQDSRSLSDQTTEILEVVFKGIVQKEPGQ